MRAWQFTATHAPLMRAELPEPLAARGKSWSTCARLGSVTPMSD